ncbi:MAG TPA: hypothetical protein VF708_04445 [Pyrinomonadaceae bacterium]|jgi:hypothetical protein
MKRCPTCQRTYTDDSLRFCLEDGATLLGGASDPMASTLLDSPPLKTGTDRSAPTEVLHSEPTSNNQASQTRSWGTPNVSPPPTPQPWERKEYSGQQRSAPYNSTPTAPAPEASAQKKRSWPGVTSLIIGIATWLMMFMSFVGAGFKVRDEFIGFSFIAAMFLSVFGIVFGVVAFGIALKNPERYGGKAVALIGLFMSLMPTLFLLLMIVIGIAVTSK